MLGHVAFGRGAGRGDWRFSGVPVTNAQWRMTFIFPLFLMSNSGAAFEEGHHPVIHLPKAVIPQTGRKILAMSCPGCFKTARCVLKDAMLC